ncbi:MAG: Bug family tripartite tricarboxylate transporter substrate binding protein [Xanthobacteraceae bacterium]|jgi:tripartite-type tricarboxylate transporter receptor subunit TctC
MEYNAMQVRFRLGPFTVIRSDAGVSLPAGLLAAALLPATAQAQTTEWPTKTVTVITPFAAGGNTDIMARLASQKLAQAFKQTFVVENRVGGAGALAANYVAQAQPDGYTLFFAASPVIAVLPNVQTVTYDPLNDFIPVSVFGTGPFILAISSALPAKTIPEFVAYAKNRRISYGSGGTGSVGHLAGALFVQRAGVEGAVHVPYRGGAPAMTGLLGGQVEMYFGNAAEIIPHAESGAVRIIGIATENRMRRLPDVATVAESFPNFALSSWNGFLVPAKTPRAIVDKLAKEVIAAARDPAVAEHLTNLGIEPNGTTPEEFTAQIAREQPQFDAAIEAAKLKQPQ